LLRSGLLLSGGMDSIAIAYWLRPDVALTIDYGQVPAIAEMQASAAVCKELGIQHHPISIDCRCLGSGDLASAKPLSIAPVPEWWPYRNQLLITIGASRALALGIQKVL